MAAEIEQYPGDGGSQNAVPASGGSKQRDDELLGYAFQHADDDDRQRDAPPHGGEHLVHCVCRAAKRAAHGHGVRQRQHQQHQRDGCAGHEEVVRAVSGQPAGGRCEFSHVGAPTS